MTGLIEICQNFPIGRAIDEILMITQCSPDDEWNARIERLSTMIRYSEMPPPRTDLQCPFAPKMLAAYGKMGLVGKHPCLPVIPHSPATGEQDAHPPVPALVWDRFYDLLDKGDDSVREKLKNYCASVAYFNLRCSLGVTNRKILLKVKHVRRFPSASRFNQ